MNENMKIFVKFHLSQDEMNKRRLRLYKEALEKYEQIQKGNQVSNRCGFCKEVEKRNVDKFSRPRQNDCEVCLCNPDLCNDGRYPSLWDKYFEFKGVYFRLDGNVSPGENNRIKKLYHFHLDALVEGIKREIIKLEE